MHGPCSHSNACPCGAAPAKAPPKSSIPAASRAARNARGTDAACCTHSPLQASAPTCSPAAPRRWVGRATGGSATTAWAGCWSTSTPLSRCGVAGSWELRPQSQPRLACSPCTGQGGAHWTQRLALEAGRHTLGMFCAQPRVATRHRPTSLRPNCYGPAAGPAHMAPTMRHAAASLACTHADGVLNTHAAGDRAARPRRARLPQRGIAHVCSGRGPAVQRRARRRDRCARRSAGAGRVRRGWRSSSRGVEAGCCCLAVCARRKHWAAPPLPGPRTLTTTPPPC